MEVNVSLGLTQIQPCLYKLMRSLGILCCPLRSLERETLNTICLHLSLSWIVMILVLKNFQKIPPYFSQDVDSLRPFNYFPTTDPDACEWHVSKYLHEDISNSSYILFCFLSYIFHSIP